MEYHSLLSDNQPNAHSYHSDVVSKKSIFLVITCSYLIALGAYSLQRTSVASIRTAATQDEAHVGAPRIDPGLVDSERIEPAPVSAQTEAANQSHASVTINDTTVSAEGNESVSKIISDESGTTKVDIFVSSDTQGASSVSSSSNIQVSSTSSVNMEFNSE